MAQAIIMPRQGISVESCIIVEWKVKEGDKVKKGDLLFVYETDKAVFEEESPADGTVLKLLYEQGDDVVCLENVLILGEPGEDISEFLSGGAQEASKEEAAPEPEKQETKTPVQAEGSEPKPASPADGKMKISPRAKNLAQKSDADLSYANATGPEGRIIERDVKELIKQGHKTTGAPAAQAAAAQSTDVGEYEAVKHSNMRKIIGKAMHESLANMAQLTLNSSFDATNILEFRKVVKEKKEKYGLNNITLNDMLLYAVSRVILKHPDINAHYTSEAMLRYKNANIGVAVDSERGLLVPTLFGANRISLNELSVQAKAIIDEARVGKINPDLLTGGTFTVTNLGTLGVESFTPVINPPQTAILGVCALTTKLHADGTPYQAMGLSLTFDHRAVDGAPAAKFLKDLCEYLESFTENLSLENAMGGAL
jgi:pyruvate dehydrogenase E2 component (dihydrolipoamide acetyltransferase)